jgi:hypothetical protein
VPMIRLFAAACEGGRENQRVPRVDAEPAAWEIRALQCHMRNYLWASTTFADSSDAAGKSKRRFAAPDSRSAANSLRMSEQGAVRHYTTMSR